MFFLFGWGHRTVNDQGPTMPTKCAHCHNDTWLHLISYRTWFTLFFCPVFPYESKSLLLCPICSYGLELSGDSLDKYQRINAASTALREGQIQESEFLALANGSDQNVTPVRALDHAATPAPPRGDRDQSPRPVKRTTRYAAANVCLACQETIGRSAATEEVSFIHDAYICSGNVHAGCALSFKTAISAGEAAAIFERSF